MYVQRDQGGAIIDMYANPQSGYAEEYMPNESPELIQFFNPIIPNVAKFAQDVKTAMGGILASNALMVAYPAFFPAVTAYEWSDLQVLLLDALAKSVISELQYSGIKAAAIINNIPISL
jgi:hypothetical protein